MTKQDPMPTDEVPDTVRTPHVEPAHTPKGRTMPKPMPPHDAHSVRSNPHASEALMPMPTTVHKELDWYFRYAESARRQGTLAFLPAHERAQLEARPGNDDAIQHRATELARIIQVTLGTVPRRHAGVLRVAFTPRRWPRAITRAFAAVAPIAVRLVCAADPWPERTSNGGLESAAAKTLALQLTTRRTRPVRLRKQAQQLMTEAVTAYVRARNKGGAPSNASR